MVSSQSALQNGILWYFRVEESFDIKFLVLQIDFIRYTVSFTLNGLSSISGYPASAWVQLLFFFCAFM